MVHAQKPVFVFRRNGWVHLNRRGRQFSQLLAAEVCAPTVVILDTPCSEVVWRVLATHSIRHLPLHFPSHMSPCAITFQLDCTVCFVSSSISSRRRRYEGIYRLMYTEKVTKCVTVWNCGFCLLYVVCYYIKLWGRAFCVWCVIIWNCKFMPSICGMLLYEIVRPCPLYMEV